MHNNMLQVMHIQIETVWELGIFIVSKETEKYADCIPIYQAFATFWNIFKYHCTVLEHGGKVQRILETPKFANVRGFAEFL